jgi:hypothetical protein
MHEQLPPVRQIGERIVVREVIQLARALVDRLPDDESRRSADAPARSRWSR